MAYTKEMDDIFERVFAKHRNPSAVNHTTVEESVKTEYVDTPRKVDEPRTVIETDEFQNTQLAHAYDQYGSLKRRYMYDPNFRILHEHIDNEFGGITIRVTYEHSVLY